MARLTYFDPHWINMPQAATGVRFYIGVSFLNPMGERGPCPACGHNRDKRLACNFWPPIDPDGLIAKFGIDFPHDRFHERVSGETFDTLTISPSIGLDPHWHGSIANGEITPSR